MEGPTRPRTVSQGGCVKKHRVFLAVCITLGAVVLLGGAALGADFLVYSGEIHHGVVVAGRSLGGLTRSSAEGVIRQVSAGLLEKKVLVTDGKDSVTIIPGEAGATVNVRATVDSCFAQGRSGSFLRDCIARLKLWFRPARISPKFSISGAGWQHAADEVSLAFERPAQDALLTITGDQITSTQAESGALVDDQRLAALVLRALSNGDAHVAPPLLEIAPAITTQQAAMAKTAARDALAAPVVLEYQGRSYVLTTEQLDESVSVDRDGLAGGGLPLTLDTEAGRALLAKLLAPVERSTVEAKVVPAKEGKGYSVTPSRDGVQIDWDALLPAIAQALLQPAPRRVAVPTSVAHPKLSTEDADQLATRRDIATFTTYFPASNQARQHNIQQVAALLDGTVVPPGAVFSFNRTVGPRTAAAGFDEAPMIRGGIVVPGVGGGTCQVSTTLFNAVFLAGLPIVERHAHSLFIDHYPVGRDATVTYGAQDFRFRNDSSQYILISASATDRSLTVSLAAPTWDRSVSYSTSPFEDIIPPDSSAEYPRYVRDPSLAPGTSLPMEPGIDGLTVQVFRVVKNATGEVLFKDDFTSVYSPKDFIVRVGPK